MKYLPVPFLLLSILFAVNALFKDVVSSKGTINKEFSSKTISLNYFNKLKYELEHSQVNKKSLISFGESIGDDEHTMALLLTYQKEYNQKISQSDEMSKNLIELLKNEIENRKELEEENKKLLNSQSEISLSFKMSFLTLLIAGLSMLPPWIQLFREKKLINKEQ